ncbi:hypothetical protein GCWU000341_00799 [Oribacterium sp. oral taxon 078 str. F0262]|nr:hypothetical protein GCWU000341_00799 [Oribacterium sp. oral taxon 078 str. F0262]
MQQLQRSVSLCLLQKSTFPQRKPSSRSRRPLSKASGFGFCLTFGLLQEALSEALSRRLKDGGAGLFRIFPSLFRTLAKKDFPRLPEGFFCVAFYDKRGIQLLLSDVLIEFCGPAEKFHNISAEAGPVCELLQLKGQGVEILRGSGGDGSVPDRDPDLPSGDRAAGADLNILLKAKGGAQRIDRAHRKAASPIPEEDLVLRLQSGNGIDETDLLILVRNNAVSFPEDGDGILVLFPAHMTGIHRTEGILRKIKGPFMIDDEIHEKETECVLSLIEFSGDIFLSYDIYGSG